MTEQGRYLLCSFFLKTRKFYIPLFCKVFEWGRCAISLNAAWLHCSCDKLMKLHVFIFLARGWGLATNFECFVITTLACHHTHTLVPAASSILAVEATSSTSISVKWAACTNDGGSSITGYVVEYGVAHPVPHFETQVVARDVFSTTLDGLTPSTEYDVRVRGENGVGCSVPSATMKAKTKVDGELNFQVVVEQLLKTFCLG